MVTRITGDKIEELGSPKCRVPCVVVGVSFNDYRIAYDFGLGFKFNPTETSYESELQALRALQKVTWARDATEDDIAVSGQRVAQHRWMIEDVYEKNNEFWVGIKLQCQQCGWTLTIDKAIPGCMNHMPANREWKMVPNDS